VGVLVKLARAALALGCAGCAMEASEPISKPAAHVEVRPDTPGGQLQFRFDPGDVVERHDSAGGRFRVHFTRSGDNAVPLADTDMDNVPDFVEDVAGVYDEVLAKYLSMGFRPPLDDGDVPDNGGDDRFDVYLVDFGGVGDGNFQRDTCEAGNSERCAGFMIQENDFKGYNYPSTKIANRILGSHEFFHAVQAAYDVDQGSVLSEGTAVWATEQFDATLRDFESFLPGYFKNPDRPIDEPLPGPVDAFSYGSAIFFQFLSESYGPGVVRSIWEATENGHGGIANPYWLVELDKVLKADANISFAASFADFARWNLRTGSFALEPPRRDGSGGPILNGGYRRGAGYPRIRIESEKAPFTAEALRLYRASTQYYGFVPDGRSSMTAALVPEPGASLEDITLIVATESGDEVRTTPSLEPFQTIDTSTATRFVVGIVNTSIEGESKRPSLCGGTVAEVDACRAQLVGEGGAGTGGAGGDDGETAGSCACRASERRSESDALLYLVMGLAALRRRVERRH
jgi:hypothetical protein